VDLGDQAQLWLAIASAGAAGVLRGVTGFGSSLLLAPTLSIIWGPADAIIITLLIGITASLLMFPRHSGRIKRSSVMPLAAAGLIFIVPGVHCLRFAEPETMRRTIAYVMLAITLLMILYPRTYFSASRWHSIIAGAIAGLIMGATSMGGPPIVLYFSGQDAETSQLKANIVVAVGILELGALLALTALRGLDLTVVLRFSVLLPSFVGALYLAERLVPKHAGIVYRHLIIALLIVTGIIAAIF
jgi:uncharacterized membrane protein YfcA